MQTNKFYLFILCSLIHAIAYANTTTLPMTFTTEKYSYSIHYPANWQCKDEGNGVVLFKIKPKPSPSLLINIQTIYTKKANGKYVDVKALMDDFYTQVPKHVVHPVFLERKPIVLLQPGGDKILGEQTTLTFNENGKKLKQWQVMLLTSDGNLFQAFAYRAPVSEFVAYENTAKEMLDSMAFK